MKKNILIVFTFLLVFSSKLYSQINVISPVPGQWANKQRLVIDVKDNAEYFYSLNGEDPKTSGFAYDGPVLIDMTGPVTLRIKKSGKKDEEKLINYSVAPEPAYDKDYSDFISTFYDNCEINYTAGTTLSIPEQLSYSIGTGASGYIDGRDIWVSENTVLSRTIPCEILDKKTGTKWRFLINVYPQTYGLFSKRTLPFTITDWSTINFEDKDLLFKIDDEYWELPKLSKTLDRSVPHTIYWQSLNYELGNPVEYFDLPAKPQLIKKINEDGSLVYKFDGEDDYKMSILSYPENEYQELFSEIGIDTFYGDSTTGEITVGVFFNSVYQGELKTSYAVNKRPPNQPQVVTKETGFYCRDSVYPVIICDMQDELYVSVSEPYFIQDSSETYTPESHLFNQVNQPEFTKVDGNIYNVSLDAAGEGAIFYSVLAYSKNGKNVSEMTSYKVIIDKYNYYYCEQGDPEHQEGTKDNPYTDFNQCMSKINNGRYAKLMIKGQMHIPAGKHEILSNCSFINQSDGEIIFATDSTIVIKSASLDISDFTILLENDSNSKEQIGSLFKVESGVIDITNCQIGAGFMKNGNLIDCYNSSANIRDSIISVTSSKYASCVTGVKSNFTIYDSIININGGTSVLASLNEGTIKIKQNSFKLTGQIGRIFELFSVIGTIENNEIKSELQNKNSSSVIYKDSKSTVTFTNNNDYGF